MDIKWIEELSLNNWPSLSTLLYDGWILRFADGYTKRANSINPLHYSTCDLNTKIEHCESLYSVHQLQPTFKITPFVQPLNLDHVLEQKGYSLVDLTSVQTLDLHHINEPLLNSVIIEDQMSTEWIENYCRLNRVIDKHKDIMERMLSNIKTKKGFVSLCFEDQVIACGLGVIEREYIGLYDIVTDLSFRNQGFGEQMILNLLKWGRANGATHSYLAVVAHNEPALRLYSKLGYSEVYKYWYRVKNAVSC
ncbi:GNAT family N-acetyltransferase [Paenibacillus sp. ACRRX]|uniref:GNAT family N-acetyltransferase n=1 Tax=Paenibacillus sp. ACRRX TaxID=2918206 RepID=UPI001EF43ACD|nr:GNAT family N-acetyltransferase [Paenibacillus sp. ACRRX]MCG7409584.1 GNAT family N-acetyltransferase [Paenibacillus sp. ACRRX]